MTKERDILDIGGSAGVANDVPSENQPVRPDVRPQAGSGGDAFLESFLEGNEAQKDGDCSASAPEARGGEAQKTNADDLKARVVEALREIYDPEIPVNIYELGLIYDVIVAQDRSVTVNMTLTTPHCPVAESMPGEVELRVNEVEGVNGAVVNLVWDPPWDMSRMTDEARLELGLL